MWPCPGDWGVRAARPRLRVLALVAVFKWLHVDYLHALAEVFDLTVAYGAESHPGAVAAARREDLRLFALPSGEVRRRDQLGSLIAAVDPQVIHALYYHHEELTLLARELAPEACLIYECRDPVSTLVRAPGTLAARLERERAALEASDGQVFVSEALRAYMGRVHGSGLQRKLDLEREREREREREVELELELELELERTSLIVPHGFAAGKLAPPSRKLSASDGQMHLAIVGTASAVPGHSRYYVDIIERLIGLGFVVHSHFFEPASSVAEVYGALARRNARYHRHPIVPLRAGRRLSKVMSRYDLMGVFHGLDATVHDETETLAVCMPTKAVCGWFHGGIPVVCSSHYGGLVEQIERHRIGFVYTAWDELSELVGDRDAVGAATARTVAMRERFSNECSAARLERFARTLVGQDGVVAPGRAVAVESGGG